MRWMTGGDTSIHIQIGAYWKLSALIITAEQFMASNCVFTVHRALPRPSWRDSPSGLWKWKKMGRVDTLERRESSCAWDAHVLRGVSSCHAITMPEMQFHFLNCRVVAGGESERLDLIVWGYSSPGIVLIKRRCPALCFPEEPTSALMSPTSRNKRDNYFGASCAGKYDQRACVALRENKAVVGVKALGGHIKAVGVASSLHQGACKLRFAKTDRRQSVLISDLRGGKKRWPEYWGA